LEKTISVDDEFHQLFLGEFALRNGDYLLALELYSELARNHLIPPLFKNVVHLGLISSKYVEAFLAAESWFRVDNSSAEAGAIFLALAFKLEIVGLKFAQWSHFKKHVQTDPAAFLGLLLNYLKMANTSVSGYKTAWDSLTGYEFFRSSSGDVLELFSVLSLRAKEYAAAMHSITRLAKFKDLNLQLVYLLITEVNQSSTNVDVLTWVKTLRMDYPNNKQLGLWEATLLSKNEEYESSRDMLSKLYSSFPKDNRVAFSLALLELQTKRLESAKNIFDRLLMENYKFGEVNFYMGRISEIEGRYKDAENYYSAVPKDDPVNFFPSQIRFAFVLSKKKQLVQSLQLLSDLRESFPNENVPISLMKGSILSEKGRYLDALAVYDEAIEKAEYDFELFYARALVAEKVGRVDILEHDLSRILEMEPDNAEVLNALGYGLASLTDRYEEAYMLIEKAIRIMPQAFHIIDSMGWVCYRLGRIEESLKYLKKAYLGGQDAEIAAHLIEVLWFDGQHIEARDLWKESLEKFPGDQRIYDLIQKIGM